MVEEQSPVFATVTVKKEITLHKIKSMLVNAFEGGVGYWCRVDDYQYAPGIQKEDFQEKHAGKFCEPENYFHPIQIVPTIDGCALKLTIEEVGEEVKNDWEPAKKEKGVQHVLLTKEKLVNGLQVMAEFQSRHFNNWLEENDDAETGDIYLQCCLFPEYVKKHGFTVFG